MVSVCLPVMACHSLWDSECFFCPTDPVMGLKTCHVELSMLINFAGVDTLCKNSRRRPLTFGEDLSSQCSLYLTVGQLSNCSLLRLV